MENAEPVNENRQERHQELVNSQSSIRAAIDRLQVMTDKVKQGDHPPPERAETSKDIDFGSLAAVLSNLPERMDYFAKDIDGIRAALEDVLF